MAADPNRRLTRGEATVSELHADGHGDVAAWVGPVVGEAGRAIGCCGAVGVNVFLGEQLSNAVWTGELARRLDGAQCRSGKGPAWDAVRQLQVFSVRLPEEAAPWPLFRRAASVAGARSHLSVPLVLGSEVLGALSVYSRQPDAFAGQEEAALSLAASVAHALGAARRKDGPARPARLETRDAVERAMHPATGPRCAVPSPIHGRRPL